MDLTKEYKHDEFVKWFIIAAITGVEITEVMRTRPMNITMQINGAEIDPYRAMKRLEDEYDDLVARKARQMVEEIKQDILEPFEDKVMEITMAMEQFINNKLGVIEEDF